MHRIGLWCMPQSVYVLGLEAASYLLNRTGPTHLSKRLPCGERAGGCKCSGLAQ